MYKLLLIEDDSLMYKMYKRVFELGGYSVEIAENGSDGYEKAKIFKPDLILLDIMMPVLNGLQTLEKLKQDPETKNFPVIMLTNLANKSDAESALHNGAKQYLIKSEYEPKEILAIVEKYFKPTS